MYKCEAEFANLNINWQFPFMISQLPAPSTEAFDFLVRGLRPFGISARSVSIEGPTTNMDDVSIEIKLLNYQLNLSITYSGFEITARDVDREDAIQILQILSVVFKSLEKIDSEVVKGVGGTKISLHLKLFEKKVDEYVSERVSAKINNQNVTPEALVFSLDIDEITKHFSTKVTIAKSLVVDNGLFLEINYQSGTSAQNFQMNEPMDFFQKLTEHYETILDLLELNLIREEESK